MRSLVTTICIFASIICATQSARILGIFHVAAYSHFQLGDKILKELAANGHEVTAITPYVDKTPTKNFHQVVLTGFKEKLEEQKVNVFQLTDVNLIAKIIWFNLMFLQITEDTLSHPNVQTLLNSNEHFDLVILEQFGNEAFKGFCHHFKAPCVVLSTIGTSRWTNPQMGNPGPPSYVPDMQFSFPSNMNFLQRLKNSAVYLGGELFSHLYLFPKQNDLLQKYFPGAPHLTDLHYNTSLMLLNSDVSINPAVPYVPNMIDIGGYHVNPPKQLPKDLQDYLDKSKEGVIFFSMGSNVKSRDFPKEKRDGILKAFSKVKQNILWKWEDETLPGQPANVKLGKWLPQQDILAHPNIKLFITHGGLLSTIETIYHGVPIIGIPIVGDQESNVAKAVIAGYGVGISYKDLNEETMTDALNKVLNNPAYRKNVKRRSKIMHDQPMKPLDRAMFWLEYVLRHRGAPHLRTAALNLTWYQYLLLDVIAVVSVVAFATLTAFYILIRKLCCKSKAKNVDQNKKRN